ncbi:hypothetical protein F5B21DRAFT_472359 [Xylaria acuta]|nr:hypothetical protein F5B21DRAFT_472359 [Xylaria acuta]
MLSCLLLSFFLYFFLSFTLILSQANPDRCRAKATDRDEFDRISIALYVQRRMSDARLPPFLSLFPMVHLSFFPCGSLIFGYQVSLPLCSQFVFTLQNNVEQPRQLGHA